MSGWFVVTGSSKGVGLEICRLLLERSWKVIGISRSPGPLREDKDFWWLECDLLVAQEVRQAAGQIEAISSGQIEGLVFNAAAGYYGEALLMPLEILDGLVAQNFLNPIQLLQHLSTCLKKRAEIFYISTSAARIPAPMMAAYAATKVAFESFIQSVAMECELKIHIIRPSEIDTDFSRVIGVPREVECALKKLSPRLVAEKTLSMLGSGRIYRHVGYRSLLIDVILRIWPSLLFKRPSKYVKFKEDGNQKS